MCPLRTGACVCNQFGLFLLSYKYIATTDECADSTVLADRQFCKSQNYVTSIMSHVAPVQVNLNLIHVESSVSLVVKAPQSPLM